MSKTYTYLTTLIGAVCAYFIIRVIFFPRPRTVSSDLIQGALIGFGLAFVSAQIYARIKAKKVNGWITMFGLGEPRNGMFLRAAHAQLFLGPVNLPQEAMYWRTNVDGTGHTLSGEHDYILHFPPGGPPPNEAFWSLTMADAKERFVANPLNRYLVGDRSGLVANPDGSVDIYIQNAAPAGHESNWLPAPAGNAVAEWILHGRPECDAPEVFVRLKAPLVKLGNSTGSTLMRRRLTRAGIDHAARDGKSFHALRRTAGTRLIESGAGLPLAAQILGHARINSSRRYFALASEQLRQCCLPLEEFACTREGLR